MSLRVGSLCSGYEGLGMGVMDVLGGELAFVADNDPGAAKILAYRYPGVKNLGDITTTDWAAVEPVDVLCAGFPCQDISAAGRRAGLRAGNRSGIWQNVARAIAVLRPSLVVVENTRGLLSAGADSVMECCSWCVGETGMEHALRASGAVLGDLAYLGFDSEWAVVPASGAGAPHRRERVFIAAWPAADTRGGELQRRGVPAVVGVAPSGEPGEGHQRQRPGHAAGDSGAVAADAERGTGQQPHGHDGQRGWPRDAEQARLGDSAAPHADGAAGGERRLPAPGQAEAGRPRADAGRRDRTPAADTDVEHLGPDAGAAHGDAPVDRPQHPESVGGGGVPAADAMRSGRGGDEGNEGRRPLGRVAADGDSPSGVAWGPYDAAISRWEGVTGRPAPRPTEPGRTGDRLSPRFVEFLMGLPEGWVTDVPGLSRNAQLKALGNGCVPQQVALALRTLLPAWVEAGEAA